MNEMLGLKPHPNPEMRRRDACRNTVLKISLRHLDTKKAAHGIMTNPINRTTKVSRNWFHSWNLFEYPIQQCLLLFLFLLINVVLFTIDLHNNPSLPFPVPPLSRFPLPAGETFKL